MDHLAATAEQARAADHRGRDGVEDEVAAVDVGRHRAERERRR